MAKTIYEAIVHGIVHDVRNFQFQTSLLNLGNLRLGILCNDSIGVIILDGLVVVEHDATTRIFLCKATGSADGLHATIGARSGDIVLQQDALPIDGADECIVDTYVVRHICGRSERNEVIESVASVYM